MSNALVPLDLSQLPVQAGTDEFFEQSARGTKFLQQVQVFSKGKFVDSGQVRPGYIGIRESKDKATELGKSIDVIPLARRPKAVCTNEPIITSYDPASDAFKRIQADESKPESGCMWGTSFLVYERSTGRFLEYFFSRTARPEAKALAGFMQLTDADIARREAAGEDVSELEAHPPMPATIVSRHVQTKKFSWFTPEVHECSTPFTRLPKMEDVAVEVTKFLDTKKDEPEKVEEAPAGKKRAR